MNLRDESAVASEPRPEWDAWSPDRRLRVSLRICVGGLYLERCHALETSGRMVQGLMFLDEGEFLGWCDADDARFDYPLMCSNLRRAGCELFRRLPGAAQTERSLRLA